MPFAKPEIDVTLRQHALGDLMVVVEIGARPYRVEAGELRRQHELVDVLLRTGEAAARRKGSRNVRRVTMEFAAGVDQQQLVFLQLTIIVAVMQDARVRATGDDRRVCDGLRAVTQELVRKLRFDLVLVPADARALHRAPVRTGRNFAGAPHQLQLVLVLHETQRVERLPHVDDFLRCRDAGSRPATNFVQQVGDLLVPWSEKPERREQRRLVGGEIRQHRVELGDCMRLVETEDFARSVRPVAKTIPDFAFRVLVAAEQNVAIARWTVLAGNQGDDRLRLRKSGDIVEITVVAVRIKRIAVARVFGRSRHDREAAPCVSVHLLEQRAAARAVNLINVFHQGSRSKA